MLNEDQYQVLHMSVLNNKIVVFFISDTLLFLYFLLYWLHFYLMVFRVGY